MIKQILIILFPVILISATCFSQENKQLVRSMTHQYYGPREGLGQLQAFYAFQDSYGYMWFSTNSGVSRFDGLHFKNFDQKMLGIERRAKPINQYQNAIFGMALDRIIFIYPDGSTELYPIPESKPAAINSMSGHLYDSFVAVLDDNLYLTHYHFLENNLYSSIFKFNLKNKTFHKIAENRDLSIIYKNKNRLYIITHVETERSGKKITFSILDNDKIMHLQTIPLKDNAYYRFLKSDKNDLFLNEHQLNNKPDVYQCFIKNDSLRFDYMMQLSDDLFYIENLRSNRFVFGDNRNNANFIYDNGKITQLPLNTLMVNHAMTDREGNLWLATEDGVYNCRKLLFESYKLGLAKNDNIWSVMKDRKNNILFSSYGYGLWKADEATGLLRKTDIFYKGKKADLTFGYMGNCMDSTGNAWLTFTDGVICYKSTGEEKLIPTGCSLSVYYDTLTHCVFAGGKIGENRNLNIIDRNFNYKTIPFDDDRFIVSIARDASRKIRLGTFRGDAWLDETSGKIVNDTVKRAYRGTVSMAADSRGFLWKGTTNGLYVENPEGKDTLIQEKETAFVLCYYNKYIIWGKMGELYILDLKAFHEQGEVNIRTFNYYDGFDALECGQNGASIDPEGYVWLVAGDCVLKFHPGRLMEEIPQLKPSPPYLASIRSARKDENWAYIRNEENIALDNKSNWLKFDILQASMQAPDKLQFRYRLNGYDGNWTVSAERSYTFQNLPFGTYRLEVQSSFGNGEWSESLFSPQITIRKPFILTLPGLGIILALFAGIFYLLYLYIRQVVVRKEKEARQIDMLKYHAVQSKFIPHFMGNVLNSINYLISKNPELAQKYVVDFARFSNWSLLSSSQFFWTLKEEIDYVESYLTLEKMRFEDKFSYSIHIDPSVPADTPLPVMILQTFCENAFKHGFRHKTDRCILKIEACPGQDCTLISVEDNGVGREKAAAFQTESTGEGLKIVRQQLVLYNKKYNKNASLSIIDLFDGKGNAAGTCCVLSV